MDEVFKYLNDKENEVTGFRFDQSSNKGLVISMQGYKHMDLLLIRDELITKFKLKPDFKKGLEEFDSISGCTFCYFKNVY